MGQSDATLIFKPELHETMPNITNWLIHLSKNWLKGLTQVSLFVVVSNYFSKFSPYYTPAGKAHYSFELCDLHQLCESVKLQAFLVTIDSICHTTIQYCVPQKLFLLHTIKIFQPILFLPVVGHTTL